MAMLICVKNKDNTLKMNRDVVGNMPYASPDVSNMGRVGGNHNTPSMLMRTIILLTLQNNYKKILTLLIIKLDYKYFIKIKT